MTQEDKELLLKDLCSRLSYKVHCRVFKLNGDIKENNDVLYGVIGDNVMTLKSDKDECLMYYQIKPYLRPLSSMMQGEWEEMTALIYPYGRVNLNNKNELLLWLSVEGNDMPIMLMNNVFSWLDKNMFDYRGLIPLRLALEAPEDMYNN